ncbi:MAG: ABC transporter permease [Gemmatimonadetes bacterium]|nr:ABC transporter permease [Gemmatimonadota bacterium]
MKDPPRWPGAVLRRVVRRELADRIIGDLDEEWAEHVRPSMGPLAARWWYWKLAARSLFSVMWAGLRSPAERVDGSGAPSRRRPRWPWADLWYDVRMGSRSLARSPGLSASAVSVSALGIAAATVVFSVLDHVFLQPLPYGDADRLVAVRGVQTRTGQGSGTVSYPNLRDVSSRSRTLEGVVGASWWRTAFTEEGRTEVVWGLTVSWDYFHILGVKPAHGRFFSATDEGEGRAPVVVLAHRVWQNRFGEDPGVVGSTVELNGRPYQVLGVTPQGFRDPVGDSDGAAIGVWRTPAFHAADGFRSGRSWVALARLEDGTTLGDAESELIRLGAELSAEWPEENSERGFRPVPLRTWLTGPVRTTVLLLAGSVLLILLVACANVANLLLARALPKRNELAVRVALGASGRRILRAALLEALVLSAVGGAVGVLMAYLGLDLVVSLAGSWIPQLEDAAVDGRVLAFAALAAVATGVVFGTIPGLNAKRMALSARGATAERRESRLRRGLVVLEVATAVVLLFGAGLFVRTFVALQREDVGVEIEGLVTMELSDAGWIDLDEVGGGALWDQILTSVRSLPGVSSAGAIDIVPLADSWSCDGTRRLDLPPPEPGRGTCTEVRTFLPGSFEALGMGLLSGRRPDGRDGAGGDRSVWISEETARALWPDGDGDPVGAGLQIHAESWTVAGIVTDVRPFGPDQPVQPMTYLPAHQEPWNGVSRGLTVVARVHDSQSGMEREIRDAIYGVAPGVPVGNVRSGEQLAAGRVEGPRFRVALAVAFGGAALLIALVGLSGLTSFSVHRRRKEMGVRMVVGAHPSQVLRMVLGESLALLGLGLGLGILACLPLGAALSRFLHSVRPWDPITLGAVALVMALTVVLACYPAALRAARADPAHALRSDGESQG